MQNGRWLIGAVIAGLAVLAAITLFDTPALEQKTTVQVYAAVSAAPVVQDIAGLYTPDQPVRVVVVPASSSVLARQIIDGAPAGLFVSANRQWMDQVAQSGRATLDSRAALIGNGLVLAAPANMADRPKDIDDVLNRGRLALCDPRSAPCGQYAKQALTTMGKWQAAQDKLVIGSNARTTFNWVEQGEVAGGILYASDAQASTKTQVIAAIPPAQHDPIIYEGVVINSPDTAQRKAAKDFLSFLQGTSALRLWLAAGFTPVTDMPLADGQETGQ